MVRRGRQWSLTKPLDYPMAIIHFFHTPTLVKFNNNLLLNYYEFSFSFFYQDFIFRFSHRCSISFRICSPFSHRWVLISSYLISCFIPPFIAVFIPLLSFHFCFLITFSFQFFIRFSSRHVRQRSNG